MNKKCNKCHQVKDLTEFYRDCTHSDGRRTKCKLCEREYIPQESICIFCRSWYTKRMKNQNFCSSKCRQRHYTKIYRKSFKGWLTLKRYRDGHRELLTKRTMDWYRKNREYAIKKISERYYKKKERAYHAIYEESITRDGTT
jgi:hypothetical protein